MMEKSGKGQQASSGIAQAVAVEQLGEAPVTLEQAIYMSRLSAQDQLQLLNLLDVARRHSLPAIFARVRLALIGSPAIDGRVRKELLGEVQREPNVIGYSPPVQEEDDV